jgi:hypothetical protein
MTKESKVDAQKELHVMEDDILKQGDQIIHTILEYMRLLGMTGIKAPTPPRPKREAAVRLTYAALLLELAFKVMSEPRHQVMSAPHGE